MSQNHRTEIITVASGKGGTGKTSILVSLGYALQVSGLRVLWVDTDTATDGLSLFLLGPRGKDVVSDLEESDTFAGYIHTESETLEKRRLPKPFRVNRGREDDHGLIYNVLVSGRGLYGDLNRQSVDSITPQVTRDSFRSAVRELFHTLRESGEWDYVLVDTRGGFAFHTTDVCALSDSFFLVTEPHFSSFYQDKNLVYRISMAATDIGCKPNLKGIVVNKATESTDSNDLQKAGVHRLDLSNVEGNFRNALVDAFTITYDDTYPVPLDIQAVESYKSQLIPYRVFPASIFSYATLVAFSGLMKTVAAHWPEGVTRKWNNIVDTVSTAIRAENERVLEQAREYQEMRLSIEKLKFYETHNRWRRLVTYGTAVSAVVFAILAVLAVNAAQQERFNRTLAEDRLRAALRPTKTFKICFGNGAGPSCASGADAYYDCDTFSAMGGGSQKTIDILGERFCTYTDSGVKKVAPFNHIVTQSAPGGQCGWTAIQLTCNP